MSRALAHKVAVVLAAVLALAVTSGASPADPTNANKLVFVGSGYVENSARQVVRTSGGVVYIFAADDRPQRLGAGPGVARAWKGNVAGIPSAFSEVDGAHRPTASGTSSNVIVDVDARLDRSGTVQLIYVDETTATLFYRTFSTTTDTWGAATPLATGVNVPDGFFKNLKRSRSAASIALDANDAPHVVYVSGSTISYVNRVGGAWSAPQTVASGGSPAHPQLAFGGDGTLHLSWLDETTNPAVRYAKLPAGGAWQPPETVSSGDVQANDTGDQGPSIVVTTGGTPYVLWITPRAADAVRIKYRTAGGWVYDQLPADLYTHAPQIYARGNDVYAFLGHDSQIRLGYQAHPAGQPWSPYVPLSTTADGTLDGSASVRWDPQHETDSTVIDAAFFDEDENDSGSYLPRLYYVGTVTGASAAGDTTPPTVTVTAPVAGSTVGGSVALTADAADDTAVAGVRFLVDGVDVAPEDATAPYATSWDATTAASGSHTVTAIARDAAGNTASSSVTVSVASGTTATAATGLVAAYAFDAGAGTVAADASGRGNNGTIAGATWSSAGKHGGALSFNGTTSVVTVPDAASLDLAAGMTLEAWVDPSALGTAWRTVLFKEQPGGMVYSLYANQSAGVPVAQVNIGGERNATGTAAIPLSTWTHLAATFDGGALRLYVNGTLVRTLAQSGSIPASSGPLRIGGNGVWPEWFAGAIDDVRVYDRALTAGEIQSDMATAVGGAPAPAPAPAPSDTTAPTVSVTAPSAGATVSGTTTVGASAADDVGVAGVQFKLDGASLGAEDTSAPYSIAWDTTAVANGGHTLSATARDAAGNVASSVAVAVTVSNSVTASPAGLVAAYSFSAGAGTTVADSSGKGNTGTISGASWTTAGKFGAALAFNGSTSSVSIPESPSLDLTGALTLEAWVDPTALGTTWRTVIFKERPGGMLYSLYANQNASVPVGQVYLGGEQNATGTKTLATGAWTHLALTYDGANLRLYANGSLVRTVAQTGSLSPSSGPLRIGGNSIWGEWFAGVIDEVRVYNRALSATEVQGDMSTPVP